MPTDQETIDLLSDAVVESEKRITTLEDELKSLKRKFKVFFEIYLEMLPQEKANEIFKKYQKETFKQ